METDQYNEIARQWNDNFAWPACKQITSGILESSFETGSKSEWHTGASVDQFRYILYLYMTYTYIIIVEMLNLFLKQPLPAQPLPLFLEEYLHFWSAYFKSWTLDRVFVSQNDSSTWIVFGLYIFFWYFKHGHLKRRIWKSLIMRFEGSKGERTCMFEMQFEQCQVTQFSFPKSSAVKSLPLLRPLLQAQPRWRVCGWHSLLRHQEQAAGIEIHRLSLWKL